MDDLNMLLPKHIIDQIKNYLKEIRESKEICMDIDKHGFGVESDTNKVARVRNFLKEVAALADEYELPVFCVSDGASITRNNGNPAIKACRDALIKWGKENGSDPNEDWLKGE